MEHWPDLAAVPDHYATEINRRISAAAFIQLYDGLVAASVGDAYEPVADALADVTDHLSHDGPHAQSHPAEIRSTRIIYDPAITYPSQDQGFRLLTPSAVQYASKNPLPDPQNELPAFCEWSMNLEDHLVERIGIFVKSTSILAPGGFHTIRYDDPETAEEWERQELENDEPAVEADDSLAVEIKSLRESAVEIEEIASITGASRKEIERVLGSAS